jgi:Arc/MetJ family transcription regulator
LFTSQSRPFYGYQQGLCLIAASAHLFAWRIALLGLASDHGEAIAMHDNTKDFGQVIFKGVIDGKPYPNHGLTYKQWSQIPPRQIRLDELVTTTTVLKLDRLLSEDSTFYGDLFPHAVRWRGVIYLEDGLHRAVRAALRNRIVLHARVLDMDVPIAQQV